MPGEEALEQVEPLEVEVVRRLVEEQHVEAREQDRRECGARRLPTGERPERAPSEAPRIETDFGGDRRRARVEIVAAEREEPVERLRVLDRELGLRVEAAASASSSAPGLGDPGAPGQVGEQRLVRLRIGLLRQVADASDSRGFRARRVPLSGSLEPGKEPEQRRLADAVRADDADARARGHDERDAVEHGLGHRGAS